MSTAGKESVEPSDMEHVPTAYVFTVCTLQ